MGLYGRGPLADSIYTWEGARGATTLAAPQTLAALPPPDRCSPSLVRGASTSAHSVPSPARVDSVEALLQLRC